MASQVSPGVVVNEFDFSDYAERISTAICGLAGWANKGPLHKVTLITNERQLLDTFGFPPAPVDASDIDVSALRSEGLVMPAIHYLREGNQLQVVRISDGSVASPTAVAAITTFDNASASLALTLTATSPGTWPNASTLGASSKGRDVDFKITAGTKGANHFKLTIREKGVVREVFDNLNNIRTGGNSDPDNFPEVRINGFSDYVTAVGHASNGNPATLTAPVASGGGSGGQLGVDGRPNGPEDFYDSTDPDKALRLFEDPDTIDINLLCAPGVNSEVSDPALGVVRGMISIAEGRGDCIVLVDPKHDIVTVALAREFINGGGGTYTGSSINSSYAAYYWPWIEVFDGHSGKQVFVPPSGIVSGIMARNDRVAEPWYAAAGFNRGIIRNAVRVAKNTTLGEREQLYAAGECVNPIVNFAGLGITIWGQKTTQRKATALNRVNVRRMLNYAKKIIATSVKFLVFEPNDRRTWRRFVNIVTPPLESIKTRRGLIDFKVICDETTNTPLQIDRSEMRGVILMKPTKAAEVITVDFTLLSTGASFNEFLEE